MAAQKHFQVKLKRSAAGWSADQRATLESLGLTRMGKTVYFDDTPAIRGMLFKMVHVLEVTPCAGARPADKRGQRHLHAKA